MHRDLWKNFSHSQTSWQDTSTVLLRVDNLKCTQSLCTFWLCELKRSLCQWRVEYRPRLKQSCCWESEPFFLHQTNSFITANSNRPFTKWNSRCDFSFNKTHNKSSLGPFTRFFFWTVVNGLILPTQNFYSTLCFVEKKKQKKRVLHCIKLFLNDPQLACISRIAFHFEERLPSHHPSSDCLPSCSIWVWSDGFRIRPLDACWRWLELAGLKAPYPRERELGRRTHTHTAHKWGCRGGFEQCWLSWSLSSFTQAEEDSTALRSKTTLLYNSQRTAQTNTHTDPKLRPQSHW